MSKKLKLSPWHDGSVKPVHVGVYEVDYALLEPVYSYWNGKYWSEGSFSKDKMEACIGKKSFWQEDKWRGVLK